MSVDDELAEHERDAWTRRALFYLAAGLTVMFVAFASIAAFTGEYDIVFPDLLLAGLAGMWTSDRKAKLRA